MKMMVTNTTKKIELKKYEEIIAHPGIYDAYDGISKNFWDGGKVLVAGNRVIWLYLDSEP